MLKEEPPAKLIEAATNDRSKAGAPVNEEMRSAKEEPQISNEELRSPNEEVATFMNITQRKKAEEELRERELRYRTLFDSVPVAVYTTDAEGVIQEFNRRAIESWGRSPEKNTEKFCGSFKLFHPDGTPMPHEECPMARILRGETLEPSELEIIIERTDGTRRNLIVSPSTLKNDRGEIIGAINCLYDITEGKEAEQALRQSEERFRQFAENSANVFWIVDVRAQRIEYINPVYEKMWGESRDAVLDDIDHWRELVHPDDREKAASAMPQVLAGKTFVSEYRIVRPNDGAIRWIRDTGFPIRNERGEIYRVAGVAQDVTEDKARGEALQSSEERFRLLVEGAKDYAMFLLDPENIITFWSVGAERLFGWTCEEAEGQPGDLIFTPEDKARGAVEKEITIALREGKALDRRWHLRKDGSRFWTDGIMMRLDSESGERPRGLAKIARDATDERRAEEELRHARDELEQRVLERTAELVASNNQLQQTIAQREQLERDLLEISEREKRRIGEDLHDVVCQELTATALLLKSHANRLQARNPAAAETLNESARTVNRNVSLARDLARGLQPAELTAAGLNRTLRELAAQASENGTIKCEFRGARGVRVRDETVALHLYRIAQEAVTNAVKHSGAQNILITLERDDGTICLTVGDDGKGLSTRKRHKGLGLHLMKYRANVLGGTLKIESGKRDGTTVTACLPAH